MEEATFFYKALRGSIENIVVCGGPFFGDLQWWLASLLIRLGGLGLYSVKEASFYDFVASRAQSWVLQDHILRNSGICVMENDYIYALACLCDAIPSFDFSYFTNKDTAPSKTQQTLASALFSEMVKDMETESGVCGRLENNKQAKYPGKNSQSPRGNKRNWNNLMTRKLGSNFEFKNKACYACGNFNHLIKDYDFDEKKMVEKPVWNNASRVNCQNSQRLTHPHPKGNFVPKAVLMKSGHKTLNTARQNSSKATVSVNTTRPGNTAYLRPIVNSARTVSNVFNRAHSHVRRPFNKFTTNRNSNLNEKVNTIRRNVTTVGSKAVVSDNKGNEANVVMASACCGNPQLELQEKRVIDSGCSRHMTGNKSYLLD
ncbi:hypothetical protein Tco_0639054 [Tanacetum coccineum]